MKQGLYGLLLSMIALIGWSMTAHTRPIYVNFYVAPNGNDAWTGGRETPNPGKTDGPFATLERARSAARSAIATPRENFAGVHVYMKGGTYPLKESFVLTREDSRVEYSAWKAEPVRIVGGLEVKDWKPVNDEAILSRMDPACRGKVLQADLKAEGISDFGALKSYSWGGGRDTAPLELFFQDKSMTLARWPNQGWATIADTPQGANGGMFAYEGDRPARWVKADDAWLHGYWTYDWADSYTKIARIDLQTHSLFTTPPHGSMGYTKGKRFYALNLLEELDSPGEYYLDRKTGLLYFWPPASIASGKAVVSLLEKPLVELQNASGILLQGLTLEAGRGKGIQITGGDHNRVVGCILRNLGTEGVTVDGGDSNIVSSCEVYETGQGGISLNGGDRKTLQPGKEGADNNLIHDYSRIVRCYRPAIGISGVGNTIAHNLIYNGPHNAIQLSGNDHIIEFNEIHHVCRETGDVGAFYMGRDWTMRGNIVRYNYFHHLGGFKGEGFTDAMAIYLDDAASGTLVYGNICFKAGRAVLIGGGRDNTVENNLFISCNPAIHVDARGIGWAKKYIAKGGEWNMYEKLEEVQFKLPPYSVHYPALASILENEPAMAKGNVISNNILLNEAGAHGFELQDGLNDQTLQMIGNYSTQILGDKEEILAQRNLPAIPGDHPQFTLPFKAMGRSGDSSNKK